MITIREFVNESNIILYHGTNKKFTKFDGNNTIWLTNDYDYASSQGEYVYKVKLNGNKKLNNKSFNEITRDEFIIALQKFKMIDEIKANKLLDKFIKKNRFKNYLNGTLESDRIFSGYGGLEIIKNLGFDYEIVSDVYKKGVDFYKIFDTKVIKIVNL